MNWYLVPGVSIFNVGAGIARPRGTLLRIRRKPMRIRRAPLRGRSMIAPTFAIEVRCKTEPQLKFEAYKRPRFEFGFESGVYIIFSGIC